MITKEAIEAVRSAVEGGLHPDDIAVDRFAAVMKAKLAQKRVEGRGGWENKDECSNAFLSHLLFEHVQKGDPVDVGNLAMMIHQRGEAVGAPGEYVAALAQLNAIVDAWEALPGGRQVKNSDVERWLEKHMGPGIDAIRGFLRRPRPDGILSALTPASDLASENERLRAALVAAKEVVDVAAGMTSCRSDDEFVWAAQAKINAALEDRT